MIRNLQGSVFTTLAPAIFVGDLLDQDACKSILVEFPPDAGWCQAEITTYIDEHKERGTLKSILDLDRRRANRIHFSDVDMTVRPNTSACLNLIYSEVSDLLRIEFGMFVEEFGEAEIVHYPENGVFIPHSDANKVKPYRAASVVLYLNDDFEGGETHFPDLDCSCKPKTGNVLVFPSHLLHGGQPVVKGEKYIIVLWAFYPGGA
jgi:hypothetical protein